MPTCGVEHIPGTQVLNGDRALLCPLPNGDYEITGWPVCGSSGICHNERRPLEAIVFIEQASDNTIRPQTAMKHFKALCSQVTINWWNPKLTKQSTRRSAGFDQTDKHQHLCVQHESGSSLHPAQVSDQTGNYPIM
ncbi:hypothetical protein QMY64_06730 [Phocaeicola dorei]|nr:hypothetical protein QMY64_06730 [Phocaeicola dorei]